MHTDPAMPLFVTVIFTLLLFAIGLKKIKQPHVIAYLLVGLALGPHALEVIEDHQLMERVGAFGVIFLLFFTGMEINPRRLAENWLVSIGGTILQVILSILMVAGFGYFLEWSLELIVFFGFVISLSSTAVVLKLLEEWKELDTRVGQDAVGILLIQDLLVVPMLMVMSMFGGRTPSAQVILWQLIVGVGMLGIVYILITRNRIDIKFLKLFTSDHELQVFTGLGICFGMAMITGAAQLSSAFGAFVGGMIVSSTKQTHWVQDKLGSIRTIFIAVFFVSVGMLIDLDFLAEYAGQIVILVLAVLLGNTILNALILKFLGESWKVSFYGGSLLSQIGEFSFVLASVGFQSNIISDNNYQLTVSIIALSLLLSPFWISFVRYITDVTEKKLIKV